MLNWLLSLIPEEYRWSVAIKKASYTVGKLAIAVLTYGRIKTLVGNHLTPDQLIQVQTTSAALAAALLEGIHDWAKLRYPNVKWL